MNNLIHDKHGNIINMDMVMRDKNDVEGKRLIINHVNELEKRLNMVTLGIYQGKRFEVLKERNNGYFPVLAIMNVETFEMKWCAKEDFKYV